MARQHSNPSRTTVPLIPHTFSEEGDIHVLINAKLANKKITLILDTGCSLTALRADIAHNGTPVDLPLKNQGAFSVSGAIDGYSVITVNSLAIGRLHLPPTIVSLMDFQNLRTFYFDNFGIAIDGLLGCDILSRYNAAISFSKLSLTLFNSDPQSTSSPT